MGKFTISIVARAQRDLDEIAYYIFTDSPLNSRAVKEQLRAAIYSLEIFPDRFEECANQDDPAGHVRSMPFSPYVIFYRIIESAKLVEVLSVRRGTLERAPRFYG